ncbi:unnamed protein product [Microthlaspi erraticum]|uniref:TIR domain-containing protein n=1 Tax=Microthlaspi erraticum TaxID=1685480 RepID=A0A6D2HNB3_9BRAS|nr:unnamed protein product [Microthlaspi erraticum]
MASSSSPLCHHWRYQVFPSFCGVDVRKTFLAHLLRGLERKAIQTFIDNGIERSELIGPELIRAISKSRIAIVVLSKNYASSSWCLNELVEILRCRETVGQTVMTIFYDIDPSDVRKQEGDFGEAFHKACHGKSEEEKHKWRLALTVVADIAGEHTRQWVDEPSMIEKIAEDVLNKLNSTPSKDFDYLVGMKAHMREMISLLYLESSEVRMVGICGPAGIGKTTIARALYNQLAGRFQLSHFMENVKGCYGKPGLDNYGSKLNLQQKLLSEMLDYKGMKINHLGGIKERLGVMKILIVLDDVDGAEQLNALARHPSWFGPGSRIIVTSEDKEVVRTHGIQDLYEVDFPSEEKAVGIFCQHAFTDKVLPPDFVELTIEAVKLAGYLPSCICVLGSVLRGKVKKEWVAILSRVRTSINGKFENILRHRQRYDALHEDDKALFLHIACLKVDRLKRLLANTGLDVSFGLTRLVDKSLIHISRQNCIGMHYLLQQVGIEAVRNQFLHEPGKRQFLVEAKEIHDVLTFNTGTGGVIGISLNTSELNCDLSINDHTFETLPNLQFLKVIKKENDKRVRVHLPPKPPRSAT